MIFETGKLVQKKQFFKSSHLILERGKQDLGNLKLRIFVLIGYKPGPIPKFNNKKYQSINNYTILIGPAFWDLCFISKENIEFIS